MKSKLDKQKQIFSLLNHKFGNLLTEVEQDSAEVPPDSGDGARKAPQSDLLDRVYYFYRSIIQNLTSGLFAIDQSGEITFANRTAANMLGYPIEELQNRNIRELFSDHAESQKTLRVLFLPGKKLEEREVQFVRKDGTRIIVGLSVSPIHDKDNEFEGVVLLFRDLTEIHHLKVQVERMERLALLGELSAGIAHEIRNPLGGIKAAAQVLEESFGVDDFRFQLVDRIVREVDKANRLLQEFFKFAKPTKPKLDFYDVEMIIDGVYLLLAPKLKKRNIHFNGNFGSEVPRVFVDETQIEQVVLNLFLNSIDAMPAGGTLTVSTSKKRLKILEQEREKLEVEKNELTFVLVEIADTGVGIPDENVEKIFNPFFTTKTEGVGLGLSICSRLMEENGGKIDILSGQSKGVAFLLALPAFLHR